MADIVVTAANVKAGSNAVKDLADAGVAIVAGQAIYRSSITLKWALADSNAIDQEARRATHIALANAAADQPLVGQRSGDINIGATLTAGAAYYLSDTAGGICPTVDVGAGESVCLIGMAKSASVLSIDIQFPGVTL